MADACVSISGMATLQVWTHQVASYYSQHARTNLSLILNHQLFFLVKKFFWLIDRWGMNLCHYMNLFIAGVKFVLKVSNTFLCSPSRSSRRCEPSNHKLAPVVPAGQRGQHVERRIVHLVARLEFVGQCLVSHPPQVDEARTEDVTRELILTSDADYSSVSLALNSPSTICALSPPSLSGNYYRNMGLKKTSPPLLYHSSSSSSSSSSPSSPHP